MNKVALITGAARRVGADTARVLHAANMNIVLHYHHSEQEAKDLCAQLNAQRPHSAITLAADLHHTSQLAYLVQQAASEWGRLDVLINNASRFYKTAMGSVTEAIWNDLLDSNLKAPFFLAQAACEHLRVQQGCIVNITDIHAERPLGEYGIYSVSKAGLRMLTQVLAKELGPDIRVNAVAPGAVIWPEGENTLDDYYKQKIIDRTALGRAGTARDIAKAVLFLVRDADYITGEVLAVDGGRSLSI